jgi:hypothetical protein
MVLFSLGGATPSAALDHARAAGHGAADSFLVLWGGGRRGRARAWLIFLTRMRKLLRQCRKCFRIKRPRPRRGGFADSGLETIRYGVWDPRFGQRRICVSAGSLRCCTMPPEKLAPCIACLVYARERFFDGGMWASTE